jgi:hypothetical protein
MSKRKPHLPSKAEILFCDTKKHKAASIKAHKAKERYYHWTVTLADTELAFWYAKLNRDFPYRLADTFERSTLEAAIHVKESNAKLKAMRTWLHANVASSMAEWLKASAENRKEKEREMFGWLDDSTSEIK